MPFGNQIDHWSIVRFFALPGFQFGMQYDYSTNVGLTFLRFLQSWRASQAPCLARSVSFQGHAAVACRRATPRIAVTINPALLHPAFLMLLHAIDYIV
ncbi:hypothetical protein KCP76_16655 [Salmonella enterica subsp. enterica serovar Weltevreden]|nr:hypothetical protein KCP76_16655 [Salmonella enterica subsp. enterica serovar Weltevreden]